MRLAVEIINDLEIQAALCRNGSITVEEWSIKATDLLEEADQNPFTGKRVRVIFEQRKEEHG